MHRFAVPDLGVTGHDPAVLAAHLEYVRRRGYTLMSVSDLLKRIDERIPLENNAIVFTVDDGYSDFVSVGAPVFAAYDCPVTVFLVTGFVSGQLWNWFDKVEWAIANSDHRDLTIEVSGEIVLLRWTNAVERQRASDDLVERLKGVMDPLKDQLIGILADALDVEIPDRAPERYRAMSWDQVRASARDGVTFGPHTVSHPILSQVDVNRGDFEISESWRAVAEATDAAVPVFCYPNGSPLDFSARDEASVARAGMAGGFSTIGGSLVSSASGITVQDRFALPRFAYSEPRADFVQIVSGVEERKERIRRRLR